jgi:hypothetical protein
MSLARLITDIRLASNLVRAPNSLSGGHEFEFSAWTRTQHSDNIEDLYGVQSSTPVHLNFFSL